MLSPVHVGDAGSAVCGDCLIACRKQGDTTYTLMIEMEPTGLSLRPGMNARVEILTE